MSRGIIMHGKWTKENFLIFHENNLHIYAMFKKFSLEASRHRTRYSARGIFHRIRWETMIAEDRGTGEFKLDDGWSSHYARMFMKEYPHLGEFFETRVRENSYHRKDALCQNQMN